MPGKADLKAGSAFVRLFLKDELTGALAKTIGAAGKSFQSMGRQAATTGAGLAGMGAAILAPFTGSVKHFAKFGDELDKMSQRTGVAAPALAELGFAAEQSGTDLNKVENAVRTMQKTIGDADQGLAGAVDALDELGLSATQLEGMTPEDQFQAIADRVGAIEDPTKKAAAAMDVFGARTGTAILPMLDGLGDLREEARELGIVPTEKAVKSAAKVTDAINRIKRSVAGAAFEIGASLAPTVLEFAKSAQTAVKTVGTWARENSGLLKAVAAIGAGLAAAGTALVAFGGGAMAIGAALSGMATIVSTVGVAIGALFSPLGIVAAALIGGVTLWAKYTESGKSAVKGLMSLLGSFMGIGKETFGGIADALKSGDLAAAGKIAIAGLQVAMSTGLDALVNMIGGRMGEFISGLGGQLIAGDLSGAWDTVMDGMTDAWAGFTGFVFDSFGISIDGIIDSASGAVSAISGFFGELIDFASLLTVSWEQTWKIFKASALVAILSARDQLDFIFAKWFPAVIGALSTGMVATFAIVVKNWKELGSSFADLMIARLVAIPMTFFRSFAPIFESLEARIKAMGKSIQLALQGNFVGAAKALIKSNIDAAQQLTDEIGSEAIDQGQNMLDASNNFVATVMPSAQEAAAEFAAALQSELSGLDPSVSVDLEAAQKQLAVEIQAGIDARDRRREEGREPDTAVRPINTERHTERLKELVREHRTKRKTKEKEAQKEVQKAKGGEDKKGVDQDEAADQKKKTFAQVTTFSAAAAVAMSFGQGSQEAATDPAKETRKLGRLLVESKREQEKTRLAAEELVVAFNGFTRQMTVR